MTVDTARVGPVARETEPLDRRRMNLVFITILAGLLLAALDQTIVSTALPTIVGDLGGAGHLVVGGVVLPARGHHRDGAGREVR